MRPPKTPILSGFFATQPAIFHCAKTQMQNRRFPFVDRLEPPKSKYQIHRQVEIKIYLPFLLPEKGEKDNATERISQAAARPL